MMNLNIDQFNPPIAEIKAMAAKYQDLKISGPNDRAGYIIVDAARKDLARLRIKIEKDGKAIRAEARAFQKAVMDKEKELVGFIEPVELRLAAMQEEVDNEKERLRRAEELPKRKEHLENIGVTVEDNLLLDMDDAAFSAFFNTKHNEFLIAQAQELAKKQIEQERKDREARESVERERLKLEAERAAFEKEKQRIASENAKKEAAIKQAGASHLSEKDKTPPVVKVAKTTGSISETEKKVQDFLKEHSFVFGESFYLLRTPTKVLLYKKIAELDL
jgi:hypothetical protein